MMERMLVSNETIFNIQRQKILTLSKSLFLLIEKDDLLSASVISRGIHEVVASFAHVYLYLNKRLKILYNQKDTKKIQKEINQNNSLLEIDINKSILKTKSFSLNLEIKDSSKKMFLTGEWDATSALLENIELIETKIDNLPYVKFNKIM